MSINDYYDHVKHRSKAKDLEYFQAKFDCRVEDSREYNHYVRQMPSYHKDFYDRADFKIETQIIPMKAIHLAPDNLARLVAEQEHMDRLQDDANFGKQHWSRERADRAVRDANPAVERAWRNYQMLLELARQ